MAKKNKEEKTEGGQSDNVQKFIPDKAALVWLRMALRPDVQPTDTAIAEACAWTEIAAQKGKLEKELREDVKVIAEVKTATLKWVKRQQRFSKKEGYYTWFVEEFKKGMADLEPFMDKVGVMRGMKDFRYWEAMQMKHYKFTRKEETKNTNLTKVKLDLSKLSDKELQDLDKVLAQIPD